MLENLSSQQLNRAAQIKERIESLEGELQRLLGTSAPSTGAVGRPPGRRGISAAGKERIAAAQRARWARARGQSPSNGAASARPKGRRRMSPAARAKLAKAARARWAKAKAAGKSSL